MIGVSFKILARTPVPTLPPSYPPRVPPPPRDLVGLYIFTFALTCTSRLILEKNMASHFVVDVDLLYLKLLIFGLIITYIASDRTIFIIFSWGSII